MDNFDNIVLPTHANPIVIQWLKQGKAIITPGPLDAPCWIWQGNLTHQGYGAEYKDGKSMQAHREAINCAKGFVSMHLCDVRSCCNPNHIKQATQHENMLDMKSKKRRQKIGIMPRCACGLSMGKTSVMCPACRSQELDRRCHCGDIVLSKGLCLRHYSQERRKSASLKQDPPLSNAGGEYKSFRIKEICKAIDALTQELRSLVSETVASEE